MTHANHSWLPVLTDLREKETPCVLITVVEAEGSTPREAGTKMVATESELFGTIGGGNLEHEAVQQARELLQNAADTSKISRFPLGPALAQCCGGSVTVLLEPFVQRHKKLLLFGAGHVGKAVVEVLDSLPVRIKWIDERAAEFPQHIPDGVEKIVTSAPAAELRESDANTFILVMTHSHDLDYKLVEHALAKSEFAYLGLIGSATKRVKFERQLKAAGVEQDRIQKLTCPIGIEGVTGKHPKEIAVAVAAELLKQGLTRTEEAHIDEPVAREA